MQPMSQVATALCVLKSDKKQLKMALTLMMVCCMVSRHQGKIQFSSKGQAPLRLKEEQDLKVKHMAVQPL